MHLYNTHTKHAYGTGGGGGVGGGEFKLHDNRSG